jgi:hypothetical protein
MLFLVALTMVSFSYQKPPPTLLGKDAQYTNHGFQRVVSLQHGALCAIMGMYFTVLMLSFSLMLVHAGHVASYTFLNASERCCPSRLPVSILSLFLETPSQPNFE